MDPNHMPLVTSNNSTTGTNILGGRSGGTPLTPQQLRQQRLARLGGSSSGPGGSGSGSDGGGTTGEGGSAADKEYSKPSPTKTIPQHPETSTMPIPSLEPHGESAASADTLTTKVASTNHSTNSSRNEKMDISEDEQETYVDDNDEDDDDSELQAALAMSLGVESISVTAAAAAGTTETDISPAPKLAFSDVDKRNAVNDAGTVTNNGPTPMQIDHVHNSDMEGTSIISILQNPQHFSGRVRKWYGTAQPTNIVDFHCCMWDATVTQQSDQERWMAQGIQFKNPHEKFVKDNLLQAVISCQGVWGLTQQHGGPCGVLASIQAEVLRILLFGPRVVHPLSMITLDYPITLSNAVSENAPDMSPPKMRQALALSVGIILARAAVMLPATLQDDPTGGDEHGVGNFSQTSSTPYVTPAVKLVLPKPELWDRTTCLEWQHLEPWNGADGCGGGGLSEHLLTYKISLPSKTNVIDKTAKDGVSAVKRQKRLHESHSSNSFSDDDDVDSARDRDFACTELAHATAQFLLETHSLNWFQRPGGVLLMVMSLALSRGIPNLQGDMDDQGAKMTSNFGHCSQELINLLLTGQAVSNVFDNTLRPSGELICRGIQSRPAIGYLTQLEAMRYVEVGGYYKTPRFPIWVIGSTSHFTVMFGDAAALKESASDALLEKVRRAFKGMDGGAEENGFIQTSQLADFLQALDLKIPEHGVQTLAASMEAFGAGIILWEELWKRTSRLMTGASLESVLQGNDDNGIDNTSNNVVPGAAVVAQAQGETDLTDEELARRLQAEWNEEVSDVSGDAIADTEEETTVTVGQPQTEQYGHTFQLYHYNGLRGGNFKPFRVTRLTADEAIGASVSLGVSSQASHVTGSFGGDLEDVLRTKWPSCKIDWLGSSAPSID